jgi:hypothetical protein
VIKRLRKERRVPRSSLLSRTWKRKMKLPQIELLKNIMEKEGTRDLSLEKKAQILSARDLNAIQVSTETIRKYSKKYLAYNFRSVQLTNPRANAYENRKRRKVIVSKILLSLEQKHELIFLDECGIGSKPLKQRGWTLKGTDSKRTGPSKGKNISICAAITRSTVIAVEFSSRPYGELTFTRFLQEMLKFLRSCSIMKNRPIILFMDNATFHKSALSSQYLRGMGVGVIYNAPYSPHLNPCEYFFNHIKRDLAQDANIRM